MEIQIFSEFLCCCLVLLLMGLFSGVFITTFFDYLSSNDKKGAVVSGFCGFGLLLLSIIPICALCNTFS